jgi:hypothetical protein
MKTMKPLPEAIEYFTKQIIKRVSKAFASSDMTKQDFDEILNSVEKIKEITNKVKKEGIKDDGEQND